MANGSRRLSFVGTCAFSLGLSVLRSWFRVIFLLYVFTSRGRVSEVYSTRTLGLALVGTTVWLRYWIS